MSKPKKQVSFLQDLVGAVTTLVASGIETPDLRQVEAELRKNPKYEGLAEGSVEGSITSCVFPNDKSFPSMFKSDEGAEILTWLQKHVVRGEKGKKIPNYDLDDVLSQIRG
jgi:hypothetical protein